MFSLVAGGDVVCARRNARAATAEKGGAGEQALPRVHVGGSDSSLNGAASGQMPPVLRGRLRLRHDRLHALRHRLRRALQALRSSTQGGVYLQRQ